MVTFNVFILRHLVLDWQGHVWHVLKGGDSDQGGDACVRREKGDESGVWGGNQGGRGAQSGSQRDKVGFYSRSSIYGLYIMGGLGEEWL